MKMLDELHGEFVDLPDHDGATFVGFYEGHRSSLHNILNARPDGPKAAELWTGVATGLAEAGRYGEAAVFAEAGVALNADPRWTEMARRAQIFSLFNTGQHREAGSAWRKHREAFPDQTWGEPMMALIKKCGPFRKSKAAGVWIGVIAGLVICLRLLGRHHGVWTFLDGLLGIALGVFISMRGSRRLTELQRSLKPDTFLHGVS